MIQSKIEDVTSTKKKIFITVPQDEVRKFRTQASQKVNSKAKINGFRPGKIPNQILEQMYGYEIENECISLLVDATYPNVVSEHKLTPVSRPDFDIKPVLQGSDYLYAAEIEIRPIFELKNYKGLKLTSEQKPIGDEEINKEIETLRENMADLVPAAEGATLSNGLVAVMDFEGRVEDVPFEGGAAKDYVLPIGKGHFLKEFEEKIIGMKAGESRDITVTFPQEYFQKSLSGKEAVFSVTLKEIKDKKLPDVDDELAKDLGKKDLAELKADITKTLEDARKGKARQEYVEQIRKQFQAEYNFELPEKYLAEELKQAKRSKDEVIHQLRFEFILEDIAKTEKLEVKPDDLEHRLHVYAQIYRQPLAEIRKTFLSQGMIPHLVSGILIDKALDFIIENAVRS